MRRLIRSLAIAATVVVGGFTAASCTAPPAPAANLSISPVQPSPVPGMMITWATLTPTLPGSMVTLVVQRQDGDRWTTVARVSTTDTRFTKAEWTCSSTPRLFHATALGYLATGRVLHTETFTRAPSC